MKAAIHNAWINHGVADRTAFAAKHGFTLAKVVSVGERTWLAAGDGLVLQQGDSQYWLGDLAAITYLREAQKQPTFAPINAELERQLNATGPLGLRQKGRKDPFQRMLAFLEDAKIVSLANDQAVLVATYSGLPMLGRDKRDHFVTIELQLTGDAMTAFYRKAAPAASKVMSQQRPGLIQLDGFVKDDRYSLRYCG